MTLLQYLQSKHNKPDLFNRLRKIDSPMVQYVLNQNIENVLNPEEELLELICFVWDQVEKYPNEMV